MNFYYEKSHSYRLVITLAISCCISSLPPFRAVNELMHQKMSAASTEWTKALAGCRRLRALASILPGCAHEGLFDGGDSNTH